MLRYSRCAIFLTGLLIGTHSGGAQTVDEASPVELTPFTVTATRIAASEVEGPQAIDAYDPSFIESTGAFSVEEFINSLPSDNGTTTLVLIDGRPTYLDPNSLPLGMIAGIEVSRDGSMPQYVAGNPVRTALVPPGPHSGDLRPGDFLLANPELGDLPSGQRRFNTTPYRWLVSPSERLSFNFGFTYTFSDRLRLSLDGSHRTTRGKRLGPPPVTPASPHSVVPAAYNPFGHDIAVGMVHESFGPTRQDSESQRDQIGLSLDGKLPGSWKWESSAGYRRDVSQRTGEELDPAKLSVALADPDPARRFNPFADTRKERLAAGNPFSLLTAHANGRPLFVTRRFKPWLSVQQRVTVGGIL